MKKKLAKKKFIILAGIILVIVAIFFVSKLATASGTIYYVSPTGNDANSGTDIYHPWQTLGKVMQGSYTGGDSVLFEGGATFSGQLLIGSTTEDVWGDPTAKVTGADEVSPVTFGSYGTGRATIAAPVGGGSDDDGIDAFNVEGIIIKDLIVTGHSGVSDVDNGWYSAGIYFENSLNGSIKLSYVKIENVDVSGFDTGILIGSDPADVKDSGFTNVQILNNTVHDGRASGISVYGGDYGSKYGINHSNFEIKGNTVYNFTGIPVAEAPDTGPTGNGIVVGEVDTAIIENNVAHDNGSLTDNTAGPVGIWAYDAKNVTIQFNEVYNQKTNGSTDGDGFDFDGGVSDSIMQYNYSHDNYGSGFMFYSYNDGNVKNWDNNIMRYNISQNDATHNTGAYGAIEIWAGSTMTNAYVYNNTVYNNHLGTAMIAIPGSATLTGKIANNILYSNGAGSFVTSLNTTPPATSSLLLLNNDYYSTGATASGFRWNSTNYLSLSAWQSATGQETFSGVAMGTTTNPKLINAGNATVTNGYNPSLLSGYLLQAGSPMIDNGISVASYFGLSSGAEDYYGVTIPESDHYDIGANEYNGTTSSTFSTNSLDSGLVAYYSFDGQTLNLINNSLEDLSPQSNTGTLVNMTSGSPTIGKVGQALNFVRSAHQDIQIPHATSLDVNNYTLSFWVKFTDADPPDTFLIAKSSSSNNPNFFSSYLASVPSYCDNKASLPSGSVLIAGFSYGTGNYYNSCLSFHPTAETWYLITETYDGGSIKTYINGDFQNSEDVISPPVTNSNQTLILGGVNVSTFANDYLNGAMDEVKIYNRALSSQEVKQLYNSSASLIGVSRPILNLSPIAYYSFDGKDINWSSGAVTDLSGKGHTGTLVNLTATSGPAIGKRGQALQFNSANNSKVTISDSSDLRLTSGGTISAWIYPTGWGGGSKGRIVDKSSDSCTNSGWEFQVDNQSAVEGLSIYSGYCTTHLVHSTDNAIKLNQWQFVTAVINGSSSKLYVNGVDVTGEVLGDPLPPDYGGDMAIGMRPNAGATDRNFDGKIDDVSIYDHPLSQTEIQQLYNTGKVVFQANTYTPPDQSPVDTSSSSIYKLTINHAQVTGDVTDFPVYVKLDDIKSGGLTQAEANSIRVYTNSSLTTEVPREIVSTHEMWFKAPSISSTSDTDFYISMNGSASDYLANDTYGRNNVWTNGYLAVYHMDNISDSTGNGHTLTLNASDTLTDGVFGDGISKPAGNYPTNISTINVATDSDFTLDLWLKMSGYGTGQSTILGTGTGTNQPIRFYPRGGTFLIWGGNSLLTDWSGNSNVATGVFRKVTYDITSKTNARFFINGYKWDDKAITTGNDAFTLGQIGIGNYGTAYVAGIYDEMRISNAARSDAWVADEYTNQSNRTLFYSIAQQ